MAFSCFKINLEILMRTLQLNEANNIAGGYSYCISYDYSKALSETAQDVAHEATVDAVVFGAIAAAFLAAGDLHDQRRGNADCP
jgi:hypothetical protein